MRRDLTVLVWMLSVTGCGKGAPDGEPVDPPVDGDVEADADADADTDTDTDSDTDSDSDSDPTFECYAIWEWVMDGVLDRSGLYAYDPVNTDREIYFEVDFGADGSLDRTVDTLYDAYGNVAGREVDEGADGVLNEITTVTYDSANHSETWSIDGNAYGAAPADGVPDFVITLTYDVDDHLIRQEYDTDGNGQVNYGASFFYDDGLLRRQESFTGGGNVDSVYLFEYDAQDRATLVTGDYYPLDGSVDYRQISTYTDPILRIGRTETDYYVGGPPEEVREFAYDANGFELFLAVDQNPADGEMDYENTSTWDPVNGVQLSLESVVPSDPGIIGRFEWEYDAGIRRIAENYTVEEDGSVTYDAQQTWTFGGTCP